MKKLSTSVDTRNRELHGVYENSDYVNYYAAPSGSDAVEIPVGADYVEIASAGQVVWFKFGDDEVMTSVPAVNIEDGSSSMFVPASSRVLRRVVGETHVALQSSGGVVVSFWSQ